MMGVSSDHLKKGSSQFVYSINDKLLLLLGVSLSQERSTAELVLYTSVAHLRSESSSFTVLACTALCGTHIVLIDLLPHRQTPRSQARIS